MRTSPAPASSSSAEMELKPTGFRWTCVVLALGICAAVLTSYGYYGALGVEECLWMFLGLGVGSWLGLRGKLLPWAFVAAVVTLVWALLTAGLLFWAHRFGLPDALQRPATWIMEGFLGYGLLVGCGLGLGLGLGDRIPRRWCSRGSDPIHGRDGIAE